MEDWKNGKPIPHKQICGKPLDDINVRPVAKQDDVDERFPRPVAPFRRTPALLAHITALRSTGSDFVVSRNPTRTLAGIENIFQFMRTSTYGQDMPVNCSSK